jgi:hypothetical protein
MYKKTEKILLALLLAIQIPSISLAQNCNTLNVIASTPMSQFIEHNDGTVTDTKTNLMWKKCSEGQLWNNLSNDCDGSSLTYSWQGALYQAQEVNNTGGFQVGVSLT